MMQYERQIMTTSADLVNDYSLLCEYTAEKLGIEDKVAFRSNKARYYEFARHIKAYYFAIDYCTNKSVLDIGCYLGYGENVIKETSKEIIGIDTDKDAIDFACRNYDFKNIDFIHVELGRLPFNDDRFDTVLGMELIEHIPPQELDYFLRDVKRVLKKGGTLITVTPNRKTRLMPFQKPLNPDHFREYTATQFIKILCRHFSDVEIAGIRGSELIESIEKQRVNKSALRAYVKIPLMKLMKYIHIENFYGFLKTLHTKKVADKETPDYGNTGTVNALGDIEEVLGEIFLERRREEIDKSIGLFAVARKT